MLLLFLALPYFYGFGILVHFEWEVCTLFTFFCLSNYWCCRFYPSVDQRTEPGLTLLGREHSQPMAILGLLLTHTLSQWSACLTFPCLSYVFLLGSALLRSWRRPPQTLASSSQPSSRPISHGALHSTITERLMTDVWILLQSAASLQPTHHFVFLYLFWLPAVFTLFFSSAMPHQFSHFICHCLCFRTEL